MDELRRQLRVVDMMLSAMSVLRDRYQARAVALDLVLLAVTLLLTATVLVDEQLLRELGLGVHQIRLVLAVLSVLATMSALTQWRVDWKKSAERYGEGAVILASIKAELREGLRRASVRSEDACLDVDGLLERANRELHRLPTIPDLQFLALKSYHVRKLECSDLASRYPGAPMIVIRLRVLWRHTGLLLRNRDLAAASKEDGVDSNEN